MKNLIVIALAFGAMTVAASAQKTKPSKVAAENASAASSASGAVQIKSSRDSLSYAIGAQVGASIRSQGIEVNSALVARGIADVIAGSDLLLKPEVLQQCLSALQQELDARHAEQQKQAGAMADENKKAGDAYLAQNKAKAGVKTTSSGLQYEVVSEGTGRMPVDSNQVTVHYTGTLIDGKVFDSSVQRGQPVTFPVTGVIPGWVEALKMMKEGAKWRLVIPPQLAYGPQGQGPIPPNSVLIFDVELIKVN